MDRKSPRAIPIVRAIRRSQSNMKIPSRGSNSLRSTTFLVVGPRRRRIISPKAAFSIRFTRIDGKGLTEGIRGPCERDRSTTQYAAGFRPHHGADAYLAVGDRADSAGRVVHPLLRAQSRSVLEHLDQSPDAQCVEDVIWARLRRSQRQSGDGNDHRLGAGALSLSGPASV